MGVSGTYLGLGGALQVQCTCGYAFYGVGYRGAPKKSVHTLPDTPLQCCVPAVSRGILV